MDPETRLASCLWLLRERHDIGLAVELPAIIAGYNGAVGGHKSDSDGYHETITQAYIRLVGAFFADHDHGQPLVELVNALLNSPLGCRDALLTPFSRTRLFSVAAGRGWIEPDLAAFQSQTAGAGGVVALG